MHKPNIFQWAELLRPLLVDKWYGWRDLCGNRRVLEIWKLEPTKIVEKVDLVEIWLHDDSQNDNLNCTQHILHFVLGVLCRDSCSPGPGPM